MALARIYLETTMFNFPFVEDSPEYKKDANDFLVAINTGKYDVYTSEYVAQELRDTKDAGRRIQMLQIITEYRIKILDASDEAENLAAVYVAEGVISPLFKTDAIHIAMTTVNGLDFIVSLNFRHIVRPWTIERVEKINAREGYRRIGIYKPREVLDENPCGLHE